MTISIKILLDFNQYLDKFIAIQPPRPNDLKDKYVNNENFNYFTNTTLFHDISIFLKGCFDVYTLLVKQVEDLIFKTTEFYKLLQFINRTRMNVSNLIYNSNNNENNFKFDNEV